MKTENFRNFYESLETIKNKRIFRSAFLIETKISSSSFDNYKKVDFIKKIPYLYAQKMIEIANKLFPELAHLLIKN